MINQGFFETIENLPRKGVVVLAVGQVPFVQPIDATLTDRQLTALRSAAELEATGRRGVAEALVGAVQRELGVTPEVHVAAVELVAAKISGAHRRAREGRLGQQRRQVLASGAPDVDPKPSKALTRALKAVDDARLQLGARRAELTRLRNTIDQHRVLGFPIPESLIENANRARTETWAALASMRSASTAAERIRREEVDRAWSERTAREITTQAEARGTTVDRVDGALRISAHDGLAVAFERKTITAHQYGAGRAYRVAYEAARAGLKIANLNPTGGAARQPAGLHRSARELQRAYVLARLRQIELAVSGLGDRHLKVLQAVAGEGHTISDLGRGGKVREANTRALREALETAVVVLASPVHRGLKREAAR